MQSTQPLPPQENPPIQARDHTIPLEDIIEAIEMIERAIDKCINDSKNQKYKPQFIISILSLERIHLNLLRDSFSLQPQDLPLQKMREEQIEQLISGYQMKMKEEVQKKEHKWNSQAIIQNESNALQEIAECLWSQTLIKIELAKTERIPGIVNQLEGEKLKLELKKAEEKTERTQIITILDAYLRDLDTNKTKNLDLSLLSQEQMKHYINGWEKDHTCELGGPLNIFLQTHPDPHIKDLLAKAVTRKYVQKKQSLLGSAEDAAESAGVKPLAEIQPTRGSSEMSKEEFIDKYLAQRWTPLTDEQLFLKYVKTPHKPTEPIGNNRHAGIANVITPLIKQALPEEETKENKPEDFRGYLQNTQTTEQSQQI